MQNVTLKVTTTPVVTPSGIVPGSLRFSIQLADGSQTAQTQDVLPGGTSATFADVPDGAYTATVQRLDSGNNPLGAVYMQAFTSLTPVAADPAPAADAAPATYDAPVGLTVTFA